MKILFHCCPQVAMSCHFRLVTEAGSTLLGLPEVMLGI